MLDIGDSVGEPPEVTRARRIMASDTDNSHLSEVNGILNKVEKELDGKEPPGSPRYDVVRGTRVEVAEKYFGYHSND